MSVVLCNLRCEAGGSCFLVDAAALAEERVRIGRVLDAAGADSVLQPYSLTDGLVVSGLHVASTVESEIVLAFALEDGRRLQRPTPLRLRATPSGSYYDIESRASIFDRRLVVVSRAALPRGALRITLDVSAVSLGGVNSSLEVGLELEVDVAVSRAVVLPASSASQPVDGDVLAYDGAVIWTPILGAVSADEAETAVASALERARRLTTHATKYETLGIVKPTDVAAAAIAYAARVAGREWTGLAYEDSGFAYAEFRSRMAPGIVGPLPPVPGSRPKYSVVEPLLTGPVGPVGARGLDGDEGDAGTQGPTGLTGPVGLKGPTGYRGARGVKGETGAVGARGEPAPPAATGERGLVGPTGATGLAGEQGPVRTERGATGPPGDDGVTGTRGPTGYTGRAGDDGAAGQPGERGRNGTAGTTGAKGADGFTGSGGAEGDRGARGETGPVGAVGPAAARDADARVEPTFAVPPLPLTSAECYVTRPGSERAAGKYLVVSTLPDAFLAFSPRGIDAAANDAIELVLPCATTICRVSSSTQSLEVSCLVGAAWTVAALDSAVRLVATRVRLVAKSAARVSVAITASEADAHTLLRLVSLVGTRATVLSSCAVSAAGSMAVSVATGTAVVAGTLGATPRTLVFDGAAISSESVRSATVSGIVAAYPWPGSEMPTQPVVGAVALTATVLSPTGAATTTLVASTAYTAITLNVQGATVASVESVTWSVGASSGTCVVALVAGAISVSLTTGPALGSLTFTARINGTTTVSTGAGLVVVAIPVVTAGCALVRGAPVAVPLVSSSGALITEAYVDGARVTVTNSTVTLTAPASAASTASAALTVLVAPAYVVVPVALTTAEWPASIALALSSPVMTVGNPATVTVSGVGIAGSIVQLASPTLAVTAGSTPSSFTVTASGPAPHYGVVTVLVGDQAVAECKRTYAVTVLGAGATYTFPSALSVAADYDAQDALRATEDGAVGRLVTAHAYKVTATLDADVSTLVGVSANGAEVVGAVTRTGRVLSFAYTAPTGATAVVFACALRGPDGAARSVPAPSLVVVAPIVAAQASVVAGRPCAVVPPAGAVLALAPSTTFGTIGGTVDVTYTGAQKTVDILFVVGVTRQRVVVPCAVYVLPTLVEITADPVSTVVGGTSVFVAHFTGTRWPEDSAAFSVSAELETPSVATLGGSVVGSTVRFAPVTLPSIESVFAGKLKVRVAGLVFSLNAVFPPLYRLFPTSATTAVSRSASNELASGAAYSADQVGPVVTFTISTTNEALVVTAVGLGATAATVPFTVKASGSAIVVTLTSFTAPSSGDAVFTIAMAIGAGTSSIVKTVACVAAPLSATLIDPTATSGFNFVEGSTPTLARIGLVPAPSWGTTTGAATDALISVVGGPVVPYTTDGAVYSATGGVLTVHVLGDAASTWAPLAFRVARTGNVVTASYTALSFATLAPLSCAWLPATFNPNGASVGTIALEAATPIGLAYEVAVAGAGIERLVRGTLEPGARAVVLPSAAYPVGTYSAQVSVGRASGAYRRTFDPVAILAVTETTVGAVAIPRITDLAPYVADAFAALTRASALGVGVTYGGAAAYVEVTYSCDPTYAVSGARVNGLAVSYAATDTASTVRLGSFVATTVVSVELAFAPIAFPSERPLVARATVTALVVALAGTIGPTAYGAYAIVVGGESLVAVQLSPVPRAGADIEFVDGETNSALGASGLATFVVRAASVASAPTTLRARDRATLTWAATPVASSLVYATPDIVSCAAGAPIVYPNTPFDVTVTLASPIVPGSVVTLGAAAPITVVGFVSAVTFSVSYTDAWSSAELEATAAGHLAAVVTVAHPSGGGATRRASFVVVPTSRVFRVPSASIGEEFSAMLVGASTTFSVKLAYPFAASPRVTPLVKVGTKSCSVAVVGAGDVLVCSITPIAAESSLVVSVHAGGVAVAVAVAAGTVSFVTEYASPTAIASVSVVDPVTERTPTVAFIQLRVAMFAASTADVYCTPFEAPATGGAQLVGTGVVYASGLLSATLTFPSPGSFYVRVKARTPTGSLVDALLFPPSASDPLVVVGPKQPTVAAVRRIRVSNVGTVEARFGRFGLYATSSSGARDSSSVVAAVASGVTRTLAAGATEAGTVVSQLTASFAEDPLVNVTLPVGASVTYTAPSALADVRFARFGPVGSAAPTSVRLRVEVAATDVSAFATVYALTASTNVATEAGVFLDGATRIPLGFGGTGTLRLTTEPFVVSVAPRAATKGVAASLVATIAGPFAPGAASWYTSTDVAGTLALVGTNTVAAAGDGTSAASGAVTFPGSGPLYVSVGAGGVTARSAGTDARVRVQRGGWYVAAATPAPLITATTDPSTCSWMIDASIPSPRAGAHTLFSAEQYYLNNTTAKWYAPMCTVRLVELAGSSVYLEATYYGNSGIGSGIVVGSSADAIKHTGRVRVFFTLGAAGYSWPSSVGTWTSRRTVLDVGTGRAFSATYDATAAAQRCQDATACTLAGIKTSFGMPYSVAQGIIAGPVVAVPSTAPAYRADIVFHDLRVYAALPYDPAEVYQPSAPTASWSLASASAEECPARFLTAPQMAFVAFDPRDEEYEYPTRAYAAVPATEKIGGESAVLVPIAVSFDRAVGARVFVYTSPDAQQQPIGTAVAAIGQASVTVPCLFGSVGAALLYARVQSPYASALLQPTSLAVATDSPVVLVGSPYAFPTRFSATVAPTAAPSVELSASVVTFKLDNGGNIAGATVALSYEATGVAPKPLGTCALAGSGAASLSCTLPVAGSYTLSALVTSPSGFTTATRLVAPTPLVVAAYALPSAASVVSVTPTALVKGAPATVVVALTGPNFGGLVASCVSVRLRSGSTAVTTAYDRTTGRATATVTPTGVGATTVVVRVTPPLSGGSAAFVELVATAGAVVVAGPPASVVVTPVPSLAYGSPASVTLAMRDSAGNAAAMGAVQWVRATAAPSPILVTDSTGAVVASGAWPSDDAVLALPLNTAAPTFPNLTIVSAGTERVTTNAVYYGACTSFAGPGSGITVAGHAVNVFCADWTVEALVRVAEAQTEDNAGGSVFAAGPVALTPTGLTLDGAIVVPLTMPVAAWTHVCAVRAGGVVTVYVDGASVGTTTSVRGFEGAIFSVGSGLEALVCDARVYARAKYTAPAFAAAWLSTRADVPYTASGSSVVPTLTASTYRPTFVGVRFADGSEVSALLVAAAYRSPTTVGIVAPATAFRAAPVNVTVAVTATGFVDVVTTTSPAVVVGSAPVARAATTVVPCTFPGTGTFGLRARFRDEENAIQPTYVNPTVAAPVVVAEYALPTSAVVTWDAALLTYGVAATGTVVVSGPNAASLAASSIVVSVGGNTATTTTYVAATGTARISMVPTAAAIERAVVRITCPLPGATAFARITAPATTTVVGPATVATADSLAYLTQGVPVIAYTDAAGTPVSVASADVRYARYTTAPRPVLATDSLGARVTGVKVTSVDESDASLLCALALDAVPAVDSTGRATVASTQTKRSRSSARYYGASTAFAAGSSVVVSVSAPTSEFTLECWVRPAAQQGAILATSCVALVLPLCLWVNDAAAGWGAKLTPAALALDAWSHVAVVRYAGTTTLYVNGASVGSTAAAVAGAPTTTVSVGARRAPSSAGDLDFAGTISDLRVYSTAKYFSGFDADYLVQRDAPALAVTPNSYRATALFVGLRNPDREVLVLVRTTPYAAPTSTAATLRVPFPNAASSVELALAGFDATTEGRVELSVAGAALGASTVVSKKGLAVVACTLASVGTFAVVARVYRPDGKFTTLASVPLVVRTYAFPSSISAAKTSSWVVGVPSSLRVELAGSDAEYAPSTAWSVGPGATGPWGAAVFAAPAASALLYVPCVVPTDAPMFVRATITAPHGATTLLVAGPVDAGLSIPTLAWAGLAADYGQSGLSGLSVASPQCNRAPSFADFAARAFVGDFRVVVALTNAPCGAFHILASELASLDALSLGVSKAGFAPYIAQAPNDRGFARTGVLLSSSFACLAGRDVVASDFASVSLAAGRFGLALAPAPAVVAALGTVLYKIERAGTALTVSASADGVAWAATVPPSVGGAADAFAPVVVPATHAVLIGVSVSGTGHSALTDAPFRSVTAIDYTPGVASASPSAQAATWTEFTVPSAVDASVGYARVCVLYTSAAAAAMSITVDGVVVASDTVQPATQQAWYTTLTVPYAWATAPHVVRVSAGTATVRAIRVVPVANAAPAFPSAAALASPVSCVEGETTAVTVALTGGARAGSVAVYYGPSPGVLFGTAPVVGATVVVTGAFGAAGTYPLSVRATSAHGVPQAAAMTTPTSVVVAAYQLASSFTTTLESPVLGVEVTATATLVGPNVGALAAANVSVALGSALATVVSYTSPVVTFTVVPATVGPDELRVTLTGPVAGSTATATLVSSVTTRGPPVSVTVPASAQALQFGAKTTIALALLDSAGNTAALAGSTAASAVLFAVATTDLATDTFAFPAAVSISAGSATAYTTERKTVECTLSGGGAVSAVLVYAASTASTAPTLVGAGATSSVVCTFRAAGTYAIFVKTRSTLGTLQPDFVRASATVVVTDFAFPTSVSSSPAYSAMNTLLSSTLVLAGPNIGLLRMSVISVYLGAASATVTGYTSGTGPSAGYITYTVTPLASGLVAPRVLIASPATGATQRSPSLVSSTPVFVDAAGSTYTMPVSASVAPGAVVDSAPTVFTVTTTGAAGPTASIAIVYTTRAGATATLGTGALVGNTSTFTASLPLGAWAVRYRVTSPSGIQGPIGSAGSVTAGPYAYPSSVTFAPTTGFVDGVAKTITITATGASSVAAALIDALYATTAGELVQCGTGALSAGGAASVEITLPLGTSAVSFRVTSPSGVVGAPVSAGTVTVPYVFPASLSFAQTLGFFDNEANAITITATSGSNSPSRIDVLYATTAGELVQCGTGTLSAGTATVPVTLPLGTWAVSFRVTSPYGVQGALVSAGNVTARPYTYPTSASAVLALNGAVTGSDYNVLGFAAGRTYGAGGSTVAVVTLALVGVDAATQFPREVAATGAVDIYVGNALVVGGVAAYTYNGATHTVAVTSMTLGSTTGSLEFRVKVAAPSGATIVLSTSRHTAYAVPDTVTIATIAGGDAYALVASYATATRFTFGHTVPAINSALGAFASGASTSALVTIATVPAIAATLGATLVEDKVIGAAVTATSATDTTFTFTFVSTRTTVAVAVAASAMYTFPAAPTCAVVSGGPSSGSVVTLSRSAALTYTFATALPIGATHAIAATGATATLTTASPLAARVTSSVYALVPTAKQDVISTVTVTFGGVAVPYALTALASTSIYTFPTAVTPTVSFSGTYATAQDASITALAASALYGPSATGSTVCGAGNASSIVLALTGYDATTTNNAEVRTSAVSASSGTVGTYVYTNSAHSASLSTYTAPESGPVTFSVVVTAPDGHATTLTTSGVSVVGIPTGCTATTLASSAYAVVDGSAISVPYVLSGTGALAGFAAGDAVGSAISAISGPNVSFGAMGSFTAPGAFTLSTTYTGATGSTTLTLIVAPTRARIACLVQGYKFPTTVRFSQPLLTVGTATSITATTDTAMTTGVSWTATASSGTVTSGSGSAASDTTQATFAFTPIVATAATGTIMLTLASITKSLSAVLPTPLRITQTSMESARMVVGTALPTQTATLSGTGISALVAADLAVYLNTSSTQVSNCVVGIYVAETGVVSFTPTPSVSGLNTMYVKIAGVASLVSYAGSSDQGLFVDASGSTYTMPTSFTYAPTTGLVDSVASIITITTTGASAASAPIRVYYGASSGLTGLTTSAGLTQCGAGTLVSNSASVSVTLPSGTWYVYVRATSPSTIPGQVLGTAATLACRAYKFPTGVSFTSISATVPTQLTFTPSDGLASASVAIYYHATETSTSPTQCGAGTVSPAGSASITCSLPTTAYSALYVYAKVTSPSGTVGELLHSPTAVYMYRQSTSFSIPLVTAFVEGTSATKTIDQILVTCTATSNMIAADAIVLYNSINSSIGATSCGTTTLQANGTALTKLTIPIGGPFYLFVRVTPPTLTYSDIPYNDIPCTTTLTTVLSPLWPSTSTARLKWSDLGGNYAWTDVSHEKWAGTAYDTSIMTKKWRQEEQSFWRIVKDGYHSNIGNWQLNGNDGPYYSDGWMLNYGPRPPHIFNHPKINDNDQNISDMFLANTAGSESWFRWGYVAPVTVRRYRLGLALGWTTTSIGASWTLTGYDSSSFASGTIIATISGSSIIRMDVAPWTAISNTSAFRYYEMKQTTSVQAYMNMLLGN